MDYTQLIIEAAQNKQWDEVIKLADTAKCSTDEYILGIRKGFLNIFSGTSYNMSGIVKLLEFAEIQVFQANTQYELNALIREGKLTPEIIKDNCVVLLSGKATVVSRVVALNWLHNFFTLQVRSVGVKGTEYERTVNKHVYKGFNKHENWFTLTNKVTGEKMRFREDKQIFKALIRDKQINSILED